MDFVNCGHRGAMSSAPENTMRSFRLAAEQGANELELDLRVSKDGVLVVIHDATVDRTTDGTGEVSAMTLAELCALDAGDGEAIPAFDDVLAGVDTALQVEIKHPDAVDALVRVLESRPEEAARISPCCFDADIVAELARKLPTCVVGKIGRAASLAAVDDAVARGARRVLFGWEGFDRDVVEHARSLGVHVNVWPVGTPEQVTAAADLGVDGFTTDHPALLFESGYTIRDGRLVAA